MASNQKRLVKRIIERDENNKLVFNWGVFEARSHGPRQLTQVLEGGSHQDAMKLVSSPLTEGGHNVKGFRKLKQR